MTSGPGIPASFYMHIMEHIFSEILVILIAGLFGLNKLWGLSSLKSRRDDIPYASEICENYSVLGIR